MCISSLFDVTIVNHGTNVTVVTPRPAIASDHCHLNGRRTVSHGCQDNIPKVNIAVSLWKFAVYRIFAFKNTLLYCWRVTEQVSFNPVEDASINVSYNCLYLTWQPKFTCGWLSIPHPVIYLECISCKPELKRFTRFTSIQIAHRD